MDSAFASIAFAEPARAEANLALVAERLPAALWATLPTLLAQVPDPDGALNYLERYLRPDSDDPRPAGARAVNYLAEHPTALHYLLVIFSFSRFLSETLIHQPDLVTWLHRPGRRGDVASLERTKSREDLDEEFARFETVALDLPPASTESGPAVVLARFKRREYLRITLRDVLGLATLAETTLELSQLADLFLDRALALAERKLQKIYGTPQFTDSAGRRQPARLSVLSLGKLGGQELNYSSDIDLMFLYTEDGETSGATSGSTSNAEYFIRLAQAVLKLITETTPEGAVFRVDLRLRPQGSEGDLAVSLPAALDYYRRSSPAGAGAREWELQMLIKARCSAGDPAVAREFLREVHPRIYRPARGGFSREHLAALETVLNARQEITRELRRSRSLRKTSTERAAEWNVKLSPGGIRDIEFLAQCLQRLHGGADPWLAAPATASTLVALQRLHDKDYLSGRDFFRLGSAYQFLRKVEHRLQLRDGLQRHTLPEPPDALDRLARRCGLEPLTADAGVAMRQPASSPGAQLLSRIAQHFADVREIYQRVLVARAAGTSAEATDAASSRFIGGEPPGTSPGARIRFPTRGLSPTLACAVNEATSGGDAYARRGLARFLDSALLLPEVIERLETHPEWLARAADIFSRSDLAVEMLARHPSEIGVVADPGLVGFRGPLAAAGPFVQAMAELRVAYRRSVLATLVRAVLATSPGPPALPPRPFENFDFFTRLAEEVLTGAIHLAATESSVVDLDSGPFAVIALGRLGTLEMDIGSDADVIFVADEKLAPEDFEPWRRLAERFVHVVSSHTRDGLIFPVDARLRPRGGEGEMVQSVAYLRDYFRAEARGWEAATFLKARPIAGNLALARRAIAEVQSVLLERYAPSAGRRDLAVQLAHTRERLEKEGSGPRAKGGFKKVRGGYYDIEYVLAYSALSRGLPLSPANVLRQVEALESGGALDPADAGALGDAALLYRSTDHAHRLITGRPANRLPEPALASRVVRLLTQWGIPLPDGLDAALDSASRSTRALYERIVLAAGSDASAHGQI